ncbi:hypothetical protein PoB_006457100 [Plakobranchus ocellatus]|uniref:Uncharacterized protein n=1 Tax=Plakobranchus ocellatus TaxID=259542 RepID=A0AAV4D1K7_9GAST|nr:hypothetical protein PoB_006457100 [Plakobranchus ocellatus]
MKPKTPRQIQPLTSHFCRAQLTLPTHISPSTFCDSRFFCLSTITQRKNNLTCMKPKIPRQIQPLTSHFCRAQLTLPIHISPSTFCDSRFFCLSNHARKQKRTLIQPYDNTCTLKHSYYIVTKLPHFVLYTAIHTSRP